MLARSKRSAFVMASIVSLTYFASILLVSLATRYVTDGKFPSIHEEVYNIQLSWQTLIIFIISLVIMIGFGGLMINTLFTSDIHFGVSGVIRWGLFGIIDAVLVKIYPSIWTTSSNVLRELIELAIVPISYVIVFKIFPFSPKKRLPAFNSR